MTRLGVRILGFFVIAFFLPGVAVADEVPASESTRSQRSNRDHYVVSPVVFEWLGEVQDSIEEEQYEEALERLAKLRKRRLSDHEQALVWQIDGFIHSTQGDYARAIESFEKSLALGALPDAVSNTIRYNLGQLYVAESRYEQAIGVLQQWIDSAEQPEPRAHYLIGAAYAQLGRFDEALPHVETSLELSPRFNEGWRRLLLALYLEKQRYRDAQAVLVALISHAPKKGDFEQLQGVYSELGEEEQVLAVTELMYRQGYLESSRELRNLARLYLHHEVPVLAARVLESGLAAGTIEDDGEAWQLLGESWLHAREWDRALAPLEKAAGGSEDGQIYLRLARIHMQVERWDEARAALEAAIAKGRLDDPGDAQLMLGISNARANRRSAARDAFQKAARSEANRAAAQSWLEHLDATRVETRTEVN